MASVGQILLKLEEMAPTALKMDFDNVGLLVGDASDDLDAPSYHKEKGFKILLIDAQTGEWVEPEDESADRYVYAI